MERYFTKKRKRPIPVIADLIRKPRNTCQLNITPSTNQYSMTLFIKCKNCSEQIRIRKSVNDRAELERLIGNPFQFSCSKCSYKEQRSVNEIMAKESKLISTSAALILILGTGLIAFLLDDYLLRPNNSYHTLAIGGLLLIPSVIYLHLKKQERDNVRRFNQYRTG